MVDADSLRVWLRQKEPRLSLPESHVAHEVPQLTTNPITHQFAARSRIAGGFLLPGEIGRD